jgi:hypothetical protein
VKSVEKDLQSLFYFSSATRLEFNPITIAAEAISEFYFQFVFLHSPILCAIRPDLLAHSARDPFLLASAEADEAVAVGCKSPPHRALQSPSCAWVERNRTTASSSPLHPSSQHRAIFLSPRFGFITDELITHPPPAVDHPLPYPINHIKGAETLPMPRHNSSSPQLISSTPEMSHRQSPLPSFAPLRWRPISITLLAGEALNELYVAVLPLSDLSRWGPVTHTTSPSKLQMPLLFIIVAQTNHAALPPFDAVVRTSRASSLFCCHRGEPPWQELPESAAWPWPWVHDGPAGRMVHEA